MRRKIKIWKQKLAESFVKLIYTIEWDDEIICLSRWKEFTKTHRPAGVTEHQTI